MCLIYLLISKHLRENCIYKVLGNASIPILCTNATHTPSYPIFVILYISLEIVNKNVAKIIDSLTKLWKIKLGNLISQDWRITGNNVPLWFFYYYKINFYFSQFTYFIDFKCCIKHENVCLHYKEVYMIYDHFCKTDSFQENLTNAFWILLDIY